MVDFMGWFNEDGGIGNLMNSRVRKVDSAAMEKNRQT